MHSATAVLPASSWDVGNALGREICLVTRVMALLEGGEARCVRLAPGGQGAVDEAQLFWRNAGRSVEIPRRGHDSGIDDGVVLARVQINFAAAEALQRVYFPLRRKIGGEAGKPFTVQDIGDP